MTELLNFVTEFERIGDYAVNIMEKAEELQEKEASFSENATKELQLLENALNRILNLTNDAFENSDMRLAAQVDRCDGGAPARPAHPAPEGRRVLH